MTTSKSIEKAVDAYYRLISSRERKTEAPKIILSDAVLHCPVGETPLENLKEIGIFFDKIWEHLEAADIRAQFIHPVPWKREAAAKWVCSARTKSGAETQFEGIDLFQFDNDMKIQKIFGYWDPKDLLSAIFGE